MPLLSPIVFSFVTVDRPVSKIKNINKGNKKPVIFTSDLLCETMKLPTNPFKRGPQYNHEWNLRLNISGGSRGGARGSRAPLIFRPKWGPKGRKTFFFLDRASPYFRVWMTAPPPPYLKVWIRHWTFLLLNGFSRLFPFRYFGVLMYNVFFSF